MNINEVSFSDALENGSYDKNKFIELFESVISDKLNDDEIIVIQYFVQKSNDKNKSDLSLINILDYLKLENTPSSKSILEKFDKNIELKNQYDDFLKKKKSNNLKFYSKAFLVLIVIMSILAMYFGHLKMPFSSLKSGGNTVVVDVDLLAYSASSHVINSSMSPQQAQLFANEYRDKLQSEIESYLDDGYVVLNRINTYAYSRNQDITYDLLKSIGIKPVEDEEYNSKYSGSQRYDVLRNYASLNIQDAANNALIEQNQNLQIQSEQSLSNSQILTDSNGQSIDLQ